jgi:dethiobiotin synthetase
MKNLFVTGTDTEVGKTRISVAIIEKLKQHQLSVVGMKPVASGCEKTTAGLRNEDAVALQKHSNVQVDYELMNPYAFEPAIAPHIAAEQEGVEIELSTITAQFEQLNQQAEVVVVEGAGGWLVPLNHQQTLADVAVELDLDVILVVGLRLGSINHALLTAKAIEQSGCELIGWIGNDLESSPQTIEMLEAIDQHISAPCLGVVPKLTDSEMATDFIKFEAYNV